MTISRASQMSVCVVCGLSKPIDSQHSERSLRPKLATFIAARHPANWSPDADICTECLDAERAAFVKDQLEQERGQLSVIETEVSRRAAAHTTLAAHLEEQFVRNLSLGQRIADKVAIVGGSWSFVILMVAALLGWIILNSAMLGKAAFDPYPYILLNLALSCIAALQAPIIMMSQNRAAVRDRMEADEDYKINLKAELEIAALHEKIDHLLNRQWEGMVELQELQIGLLKELLERRPQP